MYLPASKQLIHIRISRYFLYESNIRERYRFLSTLLNIKTFLMSIKINQYLPGAVIDRSWISLKHTGLTINDKALKYVNFFRLQKQFLSFFTKAKLSN